MIQMTLYNCLWLVLIFLCFQRSNGQVNINLKAQVSYNQELSDIWGYTDSMGNEYALVCLKEGIAIENISEPTDPQRVALISSPRSTWRDAKTFGHFAYFVNESSGGVQVLNLQNLPQSPDSTDMYFWTPEIEGLGTLTRCHNIYVDPETGYGFLAGCNLNNGGVLILDLFSSPGTPQFVAAAAPEYAHDVYARGNLIYSSDIYAGVFSILNMEDKENIFTVARQSSPFLFTHNTWLSDDGNTIYTTDERGNAPVAAYDISDPSDIQLLDEFRPPASLNEGLIPHNVHVKDDYLITSFYTEGVIITDAHRPENLVQVGNFDTYAGSNGSFNGTWGVFPYFESGLILASDIGSGLYILAPDYIRAAYLEGMIIDSVSGLPLENVTVEILSDQVNNENSSAFGIYKTGLPGSGSYSVRFSKPGYYSKTIEVDLEAGLVTNADVELVENPDYYTSDISIIINKLEGCSPLNLVLSPSRIDTTISYNWIIIGPDTILSNQVNESFELSQSGEYQVILGYILSDGSTHTIDRQIVRVSGAPEVDFEFSLEGKKIKINNLTEDGNQYFWKFGDGSISEEINPEYIYEAEGEYLIELTAYNDCSGSSTSKNVNITTTSIGEAEGQDLFSVFPNPFTHTINFAYTQEIVESELLIIGPLGRIIQKRKLEGRSGKLEIGTNLPPGLYWLQIRKGPWLGKPFKILKTGQ